MTLFPFADYWWFYGIFLIFVFLMLALDLGVFNRKAHVVSFKEATVWSIIWVTLALTFNFIFYQYASGKFGAEIGTQFGLEFLTGYILEYSLSIDNIFIFVLVFSYFGIPPKYKHRVLFYGILGALIFPRNLYRARFGSDAVSLGDLYFRRIFDYHGNQNVFHFIGKNRTGKEFPDPHI